MAERRGCFITVEGTEGVGKSTNLAYVADRLRARGLRVVATREPGGTPLAERIRELLLGEVPGGVPAEAELLLMFAARASHLRDLIRPALERGDWVVCDRFTDATYAYQGAGRCLDDGLIATLETAVQRELRPDLTLLLDADPQVTTARRDSRGQRDRFEREQDAFFARVRNRYLERAAAEPERIRRIDAGQALPAVQAQLAEVLDKFLERNSKVSVSD